MSQTSEFLLKNTSKPASSMACLVLEDGTCYVGRSCGAEGEVFGEICFNTSLEGYLEVITDPSYAGQIVCMTYPQIGNYGVSEADVQRKTVSLSGLVVRDMCQTPSSWRSEETLPEFLKKEGVVCAEGIDTRAVVRHIRDAGAMKAVLSTVDVDAESLLAKVRASSSIGDENHVSGVSRTQAEEFDEVPSEHSFAQVEVPPKKHKVVAYDCGAKDSILQNLVRQGCEVEVVPWNASAEEVLALDPDGVFISNGPGDPDTVEDTSAEVEKLLGKVPVFGICLGHQMICKAAGAQMEKLKFGHRGANQPVMNLLTSRVEITSQNHGYGVVANTLGDVNVAPVASEGADALSESSQTSADNDFRATAQAGVAPIYDNQKFGRILLSHVNLNDGTPEGVAFLDIPAFSVQYHPEASPGPVDSRYLFKAFTRLMDGDPDYLDLDISKMRLAGWKFGSESPNA